MTERLRFFTLVCVLSLPILVRAQGVTTATIDQALGRSGQKTGDVYRVSFPRTDLHVSVNRLAIKPGLALGSWAAFFGTDDNAMVMGDLVLLEEELNPVMAKLRSNPQYTAILVYDVSRWGRFQDADEAAHYEFLCKSAGIPVHYCAETFINDGALPNMLMKAIKRTMAGEYSRELGVKVLAGLKRLAGLGFKQGGCPGYGLRRMLVSARGEPKLQLAQGERKSITTDRVILVPGPVEEVECVREIYRMLIEEKRTVYGISRELNRRKIKYLRDSKWDHSAVSYILSHPKICRL